MLRTRLTLPVVGLLVAAALLAPAGALGDATSTLTVVGTSDVSDSGLIQNVIQPQFTAAYPQFTFKYVGSATGTAIQNAESGTGGPSALIVHAASLENQFVASGYSYPQGSYGNAIFTNDFVLAGPSGASDPAGVLAGAPHNIAQAFADVAAAGIKGKATFLSRGGTTTASGTTVEEHAIWGLVSSAGLTPSGLVLCTVSAADGGGMTPISSTVQSTSGQPCPDSGTVSGTDAPSWYFINTGANQGANVLATNACTVGSSGANTCYVLTDRGTFDWLSSGTDPAGTIPNLRVVTSANSASAQGGQYALVNYFHVYIINPTKPGESANVPAAQDFVSYLTSPAFQSTLSSYLATSPGGAPFAPDASPTLTATGIPTTDPGGKPVTVTGTVTNNEPGYAPVSGAPVTLDEVTGGVPVPVTGATATTSATGSYSITFTPTSSGTYQVTTGDISQVENPNLNPVYGDILSPAASATTSLTLAGTVTLAHVKLSGHKATVTGQVGPAALDSNATVTVLGRQHGSFKKVGGARLAMGKSTYSVKVSLPEGTSTLKVTYSDTGQFAAVTSTTKTVTVPARR